MKVYIGGVLIKLDEQSLWVTRLCFRCLSYSLLYTAANAACGGQDLKLLRFR